MGSMLELALENRTLRELADVWRVSPEQAARRLRGVPFVVLSQEGHRGGGRGRPGRRLALDLDWRLRGGKPLARLLELLRDLHGLGEPFALGAPLTSSFWRPFLHPRVRVLVPPETYSVWRRLLDGTHGTLQIVVALLPPSAGVVEIEGLPVLTEPFALVDALQEYARVRNVNLLALADWLAHRTAGLERVLPWAAECGLDRDLAYLGDHRRRTGARVLRPEEVRRAHRLGEEMGRVPPGVPFQELLTREAMSR